MRSLLLLLVGLVVLVRADLSVPRWNLAAAGLNNYIIFAGGLCVFMFFATDSPLALCHGIYDRRCCIRLCCTLSPTDMTQQWHRRAADGRSV